jgi:hypothetical protein
MSGGLGHEVSLGLFVSVNQRLHLAAQRRFGASLVEINAPLL